jgi:hypothetical protein
MARLLHNHIYKAHTLADWTTFSRKISIHAGKHALTMQMLRAHGISSLHTMGIKASRQHAGPTSRNNPRRYRTTTIRASADGAPGPSNSANAGEMPWLSTHVHISRAALCHGSTASTYSRPVCSTEQMTDQHHERGGLAAPECLHVALYKTCCA